MHIQNGWLVEALDGHYGAKSMSREGHAPKWVVPHGTAGGSSAAGIDNYFTNGGVDASAHIIIDQAGVVIQGISMELAAWGNGVLTAGHADYLDESINPNFTTISIEHVKSSSDNSDELTAAQKAASFDVIKSICAAYNIPLRPGDANGGIIPHAAIDPVNRSRCPGAYPWDELFALAAQPQKGVTVTPTMKQAFRDTWKSTGVGTDADFGSGIATSWCNEAAAGRQYGPPLTKEYKTVNWNGQPIIAREFPGGRCEWSNSGANWIKR